MSFKSINPGIIQRASDLFASHKNETEKLKEQAKQQGITQLASSFPKVTNNPRSCGSRGVNVEVNGRSFFVQGKPTYIHNINEGTYPLQSIEYTVSENPKGMSKAITGDDYLDNIVENKAVGNDANVQDLQNELKDLVEKLKGKTEQLRKLENSISGKGDLIPDIGYEAVDPNSPDAAATLSKQIEEATKKLEELDKQIRQKTTEYHQKTERLSQQRTKAKEVNAELNKLEELYNDLCEHYGIKNNLLTQGMEAPEKNDLDSLNSWYKQYLDMQKDNIEKLNKLIENIKSSNKTGDVDETAEREIPEDKNEYLQNLKDEVKSLDAQFEKVKKLYLDLCEHYGVDTSKKMMPWKYMEAKNPTTTDAEINDYKAYIAMMKENITATNKEIDKLVDSDNKPAVSQEELDRLHELIKKRANTNYKTFATNKNIEQ